MSYLKTGERWEQQRQKPDPKKPPLPAIFEDPREYFVCGGRDDTFDVYAASGGGGWVVCSGFVEAALAELVADYFNTINSIKYGDDLGD